jgi:RHS repeat-associated protein
MKSVINGKSTYLLGKQYQKKVDGTTTTIMKYYSNGSAQIAERTITDTSDTLQWMLSDHLGSTSTTANADGSWNSSISYTAFGEIRVSSGITASDFRYTGQLRQAELGLYYYVARWYDPQLAHFTQADTVVPNAGDAASYDRYTYVRNNPVRYSDPSGHMRVADGPQSCETAKCIALRNQYGADSPNTITNYSVTSLTTVDKKGDVIKPKKRITHRVPVVAQPTGDTCGEASFVMIWNYTHPNNPLNVDSVITIAQGNGWYTPRIKPFTSPQGLTALASYYATFYQVTEPKSGQVSMTNEGLMKEQLTNLVNPGTPVLVDVNTIMGELSSTTHFVVITAIQDDVVYYNDPFGIEEEGHSAKTATSSWKAFWNSWLNNSDPLGPRYIMYFQ